MNTGTVRKWLDEKGYGFITPADGSGDVFVYVLLSPFYYGCRY